jgi:hypothetical protein
MSIALRKQLASRPQTSFGPFRFLGALPWLVLAAAMRVIAFGGGAVALPAMIVASIAVLQAFVAVARCSIELADGQTNLAALEFTEEFRMSLRILGRIVVLMSIASAASAWAGYAPLAPNLMAGLDGMAFDQSTDFGKFWSAFIASLVLLMIIGAERDDGKVRLFASIGEFAKRGAWLGAAVVVLGLAYLCLGFGQGIVRSLIWNFWQTSSASQFIKNLIYFVFIFSFAMLRLWVTLLIMTFGLKQSYLRGD